jgi:prophage maintenance system killer protein
MNLFDALGFRWDRVSVPSGVPTHSIERACFRFQRMLPEFVWDAGVLEGNPFTFPEVKTLLDGVTVGGRKMSDQDQILNLSASSKHLLACVKAGQFELSKSTFTTLHRLVAREEALEWGCFRGEGREKNYTPDVALGERGRYTPLPTVDAAPALNQRFSEGSTALENQVPAPFEQASAFFLFGALQQFFFDGNKRTSRMMMNGILMSNGIDAISVPAARVQEFNTKMVQFYLEKDGTDMMRFLLDCHPDADQIYADNPASERGMRPALDDSSPNDGMAP